MSRPWNPIGPRGKRRNGSPPSTITPPTWSPSTKCIRAISSSFSALKASPGHPVGKNLLQLCLCRRLGALREQMMLDEGFGQDGATGPAGTDRLRWPDKPRPRLRAAKYRLAQADEALLRALPALRLHPHALPGHDRG